MERSNALLALALGISFVTPAVWAQGAGERVVAKATDAKLAADVKYTAPPAQWVWWKMADVDVDGKLSIAETAGNAWLKCRFSRIDFDKDGFVTYDEYRGFYTTDASQGEAKAAAYPRVVARAFGKTSN